jgi:hypothetical protein
MSTTPVQQRKRNQRILVILVTSFLVGIGIVRFLQDAPPTIARTGGNPDLPAPLLAPATTEAPMMIYLPAVRMSVGVNRQSEMPSFETHLPPRYSRESRPDSEAELLFRPYRDAVGVHGREM